MAARRDFIKTTVLGAAGLGLGATARAQGRVLGANDRVVLASIGIRGQGNALKRGFARLKGVEIKTLCDVDENLFAERANDEKLKDVATFRPRYEKDMRRVFEDKDIDAVLVATPNHWHALASIWAMQAGKHVFVEKPASHTVWEGRQMVEAAAQYKKIVQVGTMNRSRPPVQAAMKFMQDGGLGKIYMARGLCFKSRPCIGRYPDGPLDPGEKYRLNLESNEYEPTWDSAYLAKVDYDLWQGPAPARPFNRNRFHYNWHWHWDTGNGDTGNQGPAPVRHRALGAGDEHPPGADQLDGRALRDRRDVAGDAQRPHHALRVRGRARPRVRDAGDDHGRRGRAEDRQPLLRLQGLALHRRQRPRLAELPGEEGRAGPGLRRSQGGRRGRSQHPHEHRVRRTIRTSWTRFGRGTRRSSTATSWKATCPRRSRTSPTSPTA